MTAGERERTVLEQVPKNLYIGGEWRAASGGGTLPVEDPATGETLVEGADAQVGDALAALTEIGSPPDVFRWFSEEAVRIHGRYMVNTTGKGRILTMRQPVGPCVFVTPWNFPMAMGTRKLAPAIAAGCTVVVKPAQQTPLSMLALTQILERAGLPGGGLNVTTGRTPRARV